MSDRVGIFNQFDEMGLLLGIPRIPGETNHEYMNRLIGRPEQSATNQGLVNWISEALLCAPYNVQGKKVFTSLPNRNPLSFSQYQQLANKSEDYYAPRVIVGDTTWIIEPSASFEEDHATVGGVTWTLWKQLDGSFDRIWTASEAPAQNVELKYMWKDAEDRLFIIHETCTSLTWQADGTLAEENPDGA